MMFAPTAIAPVKLIAPVAPRYRTKLAPASVLVGVTVRRLVPLPTDAV